MAENNHDRSRLPNSSMPVQLGDLVGLAKALVDFQDLGTNGSTFGHANCHPIAPEDLAHYFDVAFGLEMIVQPIFACVGFFLNAVAACILYRYSRIFINSKINKICWLYSKSTKYLLLLYLLTPPYLSYS